MTVKDTDIALFREQVKRIIESLGKLKRNVGRGWGTVQPYYIKSDKPMLGDVEAEDAGDVSSKEPVKVSRAFLAAQEIDQPGGS